jgi:hypothetical protein
VFFSPPAFLTFRDDLNNLLEVLLAVGPELDLDQLVLVEHLENLRQRVRRHAVPTDLNHLELLSQLLSTGPQLLLLHATEGPLVPVRGGLGSEERKRERDGRRGRWLGWRGVAALGSYGAVIPRALH